MKIHTVGDSDRFRPVEAGPNSFSIHEDADSAIVIPNDLGDILKSDCDKQKLFSAIFKLLEKNKEVTVSFGTPTKKTNYFAAELAASDTVDYFDKEYGICIEVKKDREDGLASAVIFKKVWADESHQAVDFNRENVVVRGGDYSWNAILYSPFMQMVQQGKVINIPQGNSPNSKYDPRGLFVYLDKAKNEVQIILNGEENSEDENLQNTAIIPIVVHSLKNGFSVSLNYGIEDAVGLNYEVKTDKLFELINYKYGIETCSNISIKVEEREEAGNTFTFVILIPD